MNKNLNIINVTLFKRMISLKRYGMKALRLLITIRYGTLLYRLLLSSVLPTCLGRRYYNITQAAIFEQ